MRDPKVRIKILTGFAVIGAAFICLRLIDIQVFENGLYAARADKLHSKKFEIAPKRGTIYIHDGDSLVPVALNQTVKRLYVDPSFVKDKQGTADKLASALTLASKDLLDTLNKNSEYEVVKNELSVDEEGKIKALALSGVVMQEWNKRVYPNDNFMSQVLGYVDQDGVGRYGIEQIYNSTLAGTSGLTDAETDANGVPILTSETIVKPAADGSDIVLSIDKNIQSMAELKLAAAVKDTQAEGGTIVVLEPATGRVLAMVSVPNFNPNEYYKVTDYKLFNNPATDWAYEPGSVIKTIMMSTGIDTGTITPDTRFNETGSVTLDGFTIKNADLKAHGNISMTNVLEQSLNVGAVWVLQQMGGGEINLKAKQTFYDYLQRFGFGQPTGIEAVSEGAGIVNAPGAVPAHTYATMTFGQSISVTPVQLAAAENAISEGGKLYRPGLVDEIRDPGGKKQTVSYPIFVRNVITAKTAAQVTAMMVSVIDHGPVHKSAVPGYTLAGKTGTAQIPLPGGGYDENRNEGSYVGFGPVANPRFNMMIRITRPHVAHASSTAAAVFGDFSSYILNYLKVPPDR